VRLKRNDSVLFQGDSITNAFRMPQEISTSYQMGAGWAMLVAAQILGRRPELNLRFTNRGVSGDTVDRLAARWQTDCVDLKPDVVSVLVGINETLNGMADPAKDRSVETFSAAYEELLRKTRDALPDARLILCEPFVLPVGQMTPAHLEHLKPRQAAVRMLSERFGAMFISLQRRFNDACRLAPADYWLFDGIHPNAAGQWLIANAWLDAIQLPDHT
jgi:acyl-CoA thioesterase I